jgi:membrane-bound metal-dependent hydrolase YbcI (DUF457 family)
MPSPIGHALGGIAAGWAAAPRRNRAAMWTLAAFGIAPDLDLLFHAHRGASHSIVAAGIAGAGVWLVSSAFAPAALRRDRSALARAALRRDRFALARAALRRDRLRWCVAAAAAWVSHVLLDWVGEDTWPPIGIQALWPFSQRYYQAPFVVFPSVSRQYWLGWRFVYFNVKALTVELIVLLPIAALVVWLSRGRTPGRSSARGGPPPPSGGATGMAGTSGRRGRRAGRSGSPGRRRGR